MGLFAFGQVLFAEAGDGGDEFVDLVQARVGQGGGFEELDGEEFFGGQDGGLVGRGGKIVLFGGAEWIAMGEWRAKGAGGLETGWDRRGPGRNRVGTG